MLKVSELTGLRVLVHKKTKTAKDGTVTDKYQKLGKVHNAVFSPDGKRVVGLMVKRPDAVGMIKREDAFLALDAYRRMDEKTILVTRPEDGLDADARRRLALDWDSCIIWSGMDAKTVSGKSLGYVSDAEFDEKTGTVARFLTTDGGVAHALIGTVLDWIALDMRDDPQQLVQRVATVADGAIETALDRLEIPGGYVAGSEGSVPEGPAAS